MAHLYRQKPWNLPTGSRRWGKPFDHMGRLWLLALLLLSAAACTEIRWETGRIPDVGVLKETLRLGDSTPEDVRAALGAPSGEGGVMMPLIDPRPRKIWSYYFSRGYVKQQGGGLVGDSRRIALLIYFDDGRYDGYQWFSTLPEHAQEDVIRDQGS